MCLGAHFGVAIAEIVQENLVVQSTRGPSNNLYCAVAVKGMYHGPVLTETVLCG